MLRQIVLTWTAMGIATLGGLPTMAMGATGVRACPGVGQTTTVVRDGSWLESSLFDRAGQLVYTDAISGKLTAIGRPGSPRRSLGRVMLPGGLAPAADGRLVLASGNTLSRLVGGASVYLLDPATGERTKVASNLVGANGLAHDAATGTTYTSDEFASQIDRIGSDGRVTLSWWHGTGGPNGLALSPDGRTLYASLSNAARIVAIDTATGVGRTIFRVPGFAPLPDGIALDRRGHLYVAVYLAGEVLRVDPSAGTACRIARGLTLPTSVAIPPVDGPWDARSVYVTQAGAVKRIANAIS